MPALCRFQKKIYRFLHIIAVILWIQIQLSQSKHGIRIIQFCRLFKVFSGFRQADFCSFSGKIHLSQSVIEFVICHVLFYAQESLIGFVIPFSRVARTGCCSDSILIHFSQFILGIGILLCGMGGCFHKEIKGFFLILFHPLPSVIQHTQRIQSKGISICLFIPLRRLSIVLFHAIAERI